MLFLDEFDARAASWQQFREFLPHMTNGGKRVYVFAGSLEVLEPNLLLEVTRRISSEIRSLTRRRFRRWVPLKSLPIEDRQALAKWSYRLFRNAAECAKYRRLLLAGFRTQPEIEKTRDFFDRIDFFINIEAPTDYFLYRDQDTASGRRAMYYGDKDTFYIILGLVTRIHDRCEYVEKNVLLALSVFRFGSLRELNRQVFLAKVPEGEKTLRLMHFGSELQADFSKRFRPQFGDMCIRLR